MPLNLSIKGVPDEWVKAVRARAKLHHRSFQGELMAIIEESIGQNRLLTPDEILRQMREAGLKTPSESAGMIREDRNAG